MTDFLQAPWQVELAMAALFAALAVSVVTDLRSRLILNAVTLPALAVILICFTWLGGAGQLVDSLIGVAICAGPLLLASLRGAVGMGDVKLMAVAGAAAGWPGALAVLIYVSVAGGVQAVTWLLVARARGLERPRYVPYGLAIAAGTAAAFFWAEKLLPG